jgi:hypothetical protein
MNLIKEDRSQETELRFQVSRLRSVELRRGKQVSGVSSRR